MIKICYPRWHTRAKDLRFMGKAYRQRVARRYKIPFASNTPVRVLIEEIIRREFPDSF